MQVPDIMRQCVVFLYCTSEGRLRPAGTAIFCGYPIPGYQQEGFDVLVTAQHVIAKIRIHSDDGKVFIRANSKAGVEVWDETTVDDWYHDGSATDCAAHKWKPPPEAERIGWFLGPGTATDEVIRREGIGLGDEVFMVGLFRNHLGRDRNEPIIRVGNIAAMPVDPIKTKHFGDMRAILIEARSIGGLSGSPVFVHMGFMRQREGQMMQYQGGDRPFHFLGVMHGHWEREGADIDDVLEDSPGEKVNTGIGVVVPAEQIMRLLEPYMRDTVEAERRKRDEADYPTPDDSLAKESEFKRFEDLTRDLVNTPKPESGEKDGS